MAAAAEDDSWDALLDNETELALSRTGRDVGIPIITFEPPDGLSFFGPVISRIPIDVEAVPLWNELWSPRVWAFCALDRDLRQVLYALLWGFGSFEGRPLDFDDGEFYRRCASLSPSVRRMRQEGRQHGTLVMRSLS